MATNDSDDLTLPAYSNASSSGGGEELPPQLVSKLKVAVPGYELLSVIGRGGQATVYKAVGKTDNATTVAIKLLHAGPFANALARERMAREIEVLKALKHPNIVAVLNQGCTPDGHDYFVMKFIEGRNLDDYLREHLHSPDAVSDPSSLLQLYKKICETVNAAHLKGITHRDLSPSNIRIDFENEPHILDFGLARTAFDHLLTPHGKEMSVTGEFMGKLAYASPEQARAVRDGVDVRTDVYALGIMLYQLITGGQFPYEVAGDLVDVLNNIISAKPTPPSQVVAARDNSTIDTRIRSRHPTAVNPIIEAIVLKSLEKDPADRYSNAGELAADIGNYLAGKPTVARLPDPPAKPRQQAWWKRPWTLGSAVAAAFTILVIALNMPKFFSRHAPHDAGNALPDKHVSASAMDEPATHATQVGHEAAPIPPATLKPVHCELRWKPTGIGAKMTGYRFLPLRLVSQKPAGLKQIPSGLTDPRFGSIRIGPADASSTIYIINEFKDGVPSNLYVDSEGTADLTKSPPHHWDELRSSAIPGAPEHTTYRNSAMVTFPFASGPRQGQIFFHCNKSSPSDGDQTSPAITYHVDCGFTGEVSVEGRIMEAWLADQACTGDPRLDTIETLQPVLCFDMSGNGENQNGTVGSKPIKIGSHWYSMGNLTPDGVFDLFPVKDPAAPPLPVQTVQCQLHWQTSGINHYQGGDKPHAVYFLSERPERLKAVPTGLAQPRFASIKVGPDMSRSTIYLINEMKDGVPIDLYIDSNGTGDLTAASPHHWGGLCQRLRIKPQQCITTPLASL